MCDLHGTSVTDIMLAEPYLLAASSTAGAAAEAAADRKELEYQPFAHIRRISACTSDMQETAFLFQLFSLTIQRFNAICICFNGSFCFKNADCRFTVAEWLKHSHATLEVTGSRPTFGGISDIYSLESIQSPARRDLKWSVCHCGN